MNPNLIVHNLIHCLLVIKFTKLKMLIEIEAIDEVKEIKKIFDRLPN